MKLSLISFPFLMVSSFLSDVASSATVPISKSDVLTYFHTLYPPASGNPVAGVSFEVKDVRNGYLKVTGEMEGYFVYVLFKGAGADYVVEQASGCGPECDQKFKVYKFVDGKLESTDALDKFYPKKQSEDHLAKLIRTLPKGATGEPLQAWIRLPRTGRSIDLLIVEQNPGATRGPVGVYKAGQLDWSDSSFKFVKLNPKKPSKIQITDVN